MAEARQLTPVDVAGAVRSKHVKLPGGRIEQIERFLDPNEDFFLTYGDGVGDIDVNAAAAFHRNHGRALTMTAVRPPGRFGELEMDETGKIDELTKKPQAESGFINGGFFVLENAVLDYIEGDVELEEEPMKLDTMLRDFSLAAIPAQAQRFSRLGFDGLWTFERQPEE